jgi:hypothetical protein
VAWEHYRGDTAMIPLSMLKQRVVWSSCLTMFFTFSNMLTITYYLAIYFQAVKGDSPTMGGVSILPTILSQIIMAVISGVLGQYLAVHSNSKLTNIHQLDVLDITCRGRSCVEQELQSVLVYSVHSHRTAPSGHGLVTKLLVAWPVVQEYRW